MSHEEVDEVEANLRSVEAQLEKIGQKVCNAKGGAPTWGAINKALEHVQDAIHSAFTMRPED